MKKIVVSIIFISYLAMSTGVMVNFHYCMNKLASTELFATQGRQCEKCGMDMHKGHGCCRDEVKIVKMQDDQKVSAGFSFELASLELQTTVPSAFIATCFHNVAEQIHYPTHSPPLLTEQDTYLENRVFRL